MAEAAAGKLAGEAARDWILAQPTIGPIAGAAGALSGVGTFIGVAWSIYSSWKQAKERKEDQELLRLLLRQVVEELQKAINDAVKDLEAYMDKAWLRELTGDYDGALASYQTIALYWSNDSPSDANSLLIVGKPRDQGVGGQCSSSGFISVDNVIAQLRLLIQDDDKPLDYCLHAYKLIVPACLLRYQVVLLQDSALPVDQRPVDGSPSPRAIEDIHNDMLDQDKLILGVIDRVRKVSNRQFYGPAYVKVAVPFEGPNMPQDWYFLCFYQGKKIEDFPRFDFTTYPHTPAEVYKKARMGADQYFVKTHQAPEADRFALDVVNLRKAQTLVPNIPAPPLVF